MSDTNSSGRHAQRYNMGQVIREINANTGLHSCMGASQFNITNCFTDSRMDVDNVQPRLQAAAQASIGMTLTPMQIRSTFSILRRPDTNVSVMYPGSQTLHFEAPMNDAGSPVVVDLPSGMGKTMVCVLSCILLTTERRSDMMATRTPSYSSVGCQLIMGGILGGGISSMVFAPKHLHGQWVTEAQRAAIIIKKMYENTAIKWEVVVATNVLASSLVLQEHQVAIIICDNSCFGPKKALESSIGYACLCYDECAEGDSSKTNAAVSFLGRDIFYGRILFCSADFSKLALSFCSAKDTCAMKVAVGITDSVPIKLAMGVPYNCASPLETLRGAHVTAMLYTAAVLPGSSRETVLRESCDILGDTQLYVMSLPYRASMMERLGDNAGMDVNGALEGTTRFNDTFGVDISSCQTIRDIVYKLQCTATKHYSGASPPTMVLSEKTARAIDTLNRMEGEHCPVCFDRKHFSCILQPCLHMLCASCMSKLKWYSSPGNSCPMCRGQITGTVGATAMKSVAEDYQTESKKMRFSHPTLGDAFFDDMEQDTSLLSVSDTLKRVLWSLRRAKHETGGNTMRVMVICSAVDIDEGVFSESYDVTKYVTKGTKQNPCRRKKLESSLRSFQVDDGRCKLLLCTDSVQESCFSRKSEDNMTGLDFPTLQAVVSLGSTNRAQRVGRVCRLSRMALSRHERDAIYVELYKTC